MLNPDLKTIDPLKRQPERGIEGSEMSPMDPPEAYTPPAADSVELEEMHPYLRKFSEEHAPFLKDVNEFEAAIVAVQNEGYTKERDRTLKHFFHIFDEFFIPHSREEEQSFFPLLEKRLIEKGEHGRGDVLTTPVTIMLDEHLKAVQLASVILNFLAMVARLPDERSKLLILDCALEKGKELVEVLRLHIFREDNIVFPMAHKLISHDEFDTIEPKKVT